MKKLQFIDIGKPFRIIGKICKDIEREFRFKGINVNFIGMLIDYIGIAFIFKWNLQLYKRLRKVTLFSTLRSYLFCIIKKFFTNKKSSAKQSFKVS